MTICTDNKMRHGVCCNMEIVSQCIYLKIAQSDFVGQLEWIHITQTADGQLRDENWLCMALTLLL